MCAYNVYVCMYMCVFVSALCVRASVGVHVGVMCVHVGVNVGAYVYGGVNDINFILRAFFCGEVGFIASL